MTKSRTRLAIIVSAAFVLGACGIKGELETPPPIWGKKKSQQAPAPAPTPNTTNFVPKG